MKITICASIDFAFKIKEIVEKLENDGHSVEIPMTAKKIIDGELSMDDFQKEKNQNGDGAFRKIKFDVIKKHYKLIGESDAILVINCDKKGIENYIGGNTLMELGFAHVLDKKIFLLNPIPEISYKDEIVAMQPIILNGDLSKIK